MSIIELNPRIAEALNPRKLNLFLLPTEKCNFRCTYCYEDFILGVMKPELVTAIKKLIANRVSDLDVLEISWFGGEPLLAKSVIYEISSHIVSLACEQSKLKYRANITTNGFILDLDTFNKLVSLGLQTFQISLDGDSPLHNRTRLKANGKGTFETIWQNLLAIRSTNHEVTIVLRVHFAPDTWHQLFSLVDLINDEFGDDPRFSVFLKGIEPLGGPNNDRIRVIPEADKAKIKQSLEDRLYPRLIYKPPSDGQYVCYASKANSLVIRSNGEIAKCTVAFSDPRNRIGHLNLDGTVHIDRDLFLPWLKGLETGDTATLACPYNTIKNGISLYPDKILVESDIRRKHTQKRDTN